MPSQWLELSEQERIDAVLEHHRGDGFEPSRAKLHAVTHVVIENILAEGLVDGAAAKLRELVADGLDRHEAIHALGTAVAGSISDVLRSTDRTTAPGERERDLASRIAEVSAESWRGTRRRTRIQRHPGSPSSKRNATSSTTRSPTRSSRAAVMPSLRSSVGSKRASSPTT